MGFRWFGGQRVNVSKFPLKDTEIDRTVRDYLEVCREMWQALKVFYSYEVLHHFFVEIDLTAAVTYT